MYLSHCLIASNVPSFSGSFSKPANSVPTPSRRFPTTSRHIPELELAAVCDDGFVEDGPTL
jgi:hypothetical protein